MKQKAGKRLLFSIPVSLVAIAIAGLMVLVAVPGRAAGTADMRVPVPNRTIYPGQTIEPGMLRWVKWRAGTERLSGVAARGEELVGKVARLTLVANRLVYMSSLRERYVVEKGQVVRVKLRSGGIEMSGRAIAQTSAVLGEAIQLRNLDTGRVITGTAVADGQVLLGGAP